MNGYLILGMLFVLDKEASDGEKTQSQNQRLPQRAEENASGHRR